MWLTSSENPVPPTKGQIRQNEQEQSIPTPSVTVTCTHTMGQDYSPTVPSPGTNPPIYPSSLPLVWGLKSEKTRQTLFPSDTETRFLDYLNRSNVTGHSLEKRSSYTGKPSDDAGGTDPIFLNFVVEKEWLRGVTDHFFWSYNSWLSTWLIILDRSYFFTTKAMRLWQFLRVLG